MGPEGIRATRSHSDGVGDEGREAARTLSSEAARIYEAAEQSNMVALNEAELLELVEATGDAGAGVVARVIRRVAHANRRSLATGLGAYFAKHGSAL